MIIFLTIIFIIFSIFFIVLSLRNISVYSLRSELIFEEYEWRNNHASYFVNGKYQEFMRYHALPSYDKMLLSFWKSVKSYKTDLKPIEKYYED